ncbi:heparinase II/III family protein [Sanguibacter sp. HDW7]|uniref:heparinase II/III domain-containing protein n=1 Tax=Sanguibacter sp. HDW7 TaxID=2714931 RepID=UPI001981DA9F|nr:heparinase II/III family protein [Sanguibacter sp. HDW7]
MTTTFHGPLAAALDARLPAGTRASDHLLGADAALPVPPATDRTAWATVDAPTLRAILTRADAERDDPWHVPTATQAARYHGDGDRLGYEDQVAGRQQRLARAATAAAATGDADRLDAVADLVWQLCEQSSWCWPAHDDVRAARGWVLPDPDRPYLDLGAGEVVGQLAWTDHLLGVALDERFPGLRARIRREARIRVITPFLDRRDWHWLGLDGDVHNWNPWIHGNVLVAALRLLDDPADAALRARVVELCVEGLDRYVAVLPADGAIDEGYEYWWNGACRAIEALGILAHATGGAADVLGPDGVPALRAALGFPHRMRLGDGWYLNVADGRARPPRDMAWHALHRAAAHAGDDDARRHAAAHREPGTPVADVAAGFGRLLQALTDTAWRDARPERAPLPADVWLPSVEIRIVREQADDPRGLALAVKGGHNAEHHNHLDVGSFVVTSDGVPVVVDVGRPTYTAVTFSPRRYTLWPMQSTWHNVPRISGAEQGVGRTFAARGTTRLDDGLTLDLAQAYPVEGLERWVRTARLRRDGEGAYVEVTDAWRADADVSGACVHLVLAGRVMLHDDGATIVPVAGARPLRLGWDRGTTVRVEERALDDEMLAQVWGTRVTRLELEPAGRQELRVVARVLDDRAGAHMTGSEETL